MFQNHLQAICEYISNKCDFYELCMKTSIENALYLLIILAEKLMLPIREEVIHILLN